MGRVCLCPDRLCLWFNAPHSAHDHDRAVDDGHRAHYFGAEIDMGVAFRLIQFPLHRQEVAADVMVIPRSRSCGIQSSWVVLPTPSCRVVVHEKATSPSGAVAIISDGWRQNRGIVTLKLARRSPFVLVQNGRHKRCYDYEAVAKVHSGLRPSLTPESSVALSRRMPSIRLSRAPCLRASGPASLPKRLSPRPPRMRAQWHTLSQITRIQPFRRAG